MSSEQSSADREPASRAGGAEAGHLEEEEGQPAGGPATLDQEDDGGREN